MTAIDSRTFLLDAKLPCRSRVFQLSATDHRAANGCSPAAVSGVSGERYRPTSRFSMALLASMVLHATAIFATSQIAGDITDASSTQGPLTVRLAQARQLSPLPQTNESATHPHQNSSSSQSLAEKASQPARFLSDPDLSILETIPVTLPGSVTLKLKISTHGKVVQVKIVRADPAPKELIDGLMARFSEAHLMPAMLDQQPTESSLEVTVRFEPGLVPLENQDSKSP
jgi:hypothetical protein